MKKNKNGNNIFVYIILLIIFIFISIIIYSVVSEDKKKTQSIEEENIDLELDEDIVIASIKPFDEEETIKVLINNIEYDLKLENNISSYDLTTILPLEITMDDLNSNEKYNYLSFSLTDDDNYSGKIKKGDVMLYKTNCIVIFYKDIDTLNTYTKLGHIDNLPDFNDDPINVVFK